LEFRRVLFRSLKGIGVEALDASKNIRPVGDVLKEVGAALKTRPNAQRLSILKELFDQRAAGAAAKLGQADFEALFNAIDNAAGKASETAREMDAGIGGAFRRLMSGAEGIAIAVGNSLAPALSQVGDAIANATQLVTKFVNENQGMIQGAAQFAAIAIGLGGALLGIGMAVKVVAFAIGGLAALFSGMIAVVGFLLSPMV